MDPLQNQKWLITWRASSPWRARSWKCIVDEWSKRMLTQIEQQTSRGWQSSATAWSRQAYEASRSSRHTHTVINCGIQWPPRVLWLSTSDKKWWLNWSDEDKLGTLLELSGKKKTSSGLENPISYSEKGHRDGTDREESLNSSCCKPAISPRVGVSNTVSASVRVDYYFSSSAHSLLYVNIQLMPFASLCAYRRIWSPSQQYLFSLIWSCQSQWQQFKLSIELKFSVSGTFQSSLHQWDGTMRATQRGAIHFTQTAGSVKINACLRPCGELTTLCTVHTSIHR